MVASDDASWSRAFMASSGIALGNDGSTPRPESAERHEAISDRLSRERLLKLATVKDPEVREAIAARVDCPIGVLASLSHDRRTDVRVAAAGNPRATRAVLEHLAADRESAVLKAVARNEQTPHDLIEKLAFHRKEEVRRVASRRLNDAQDERAQGPLAPMHRELPGELVDRATPLPGPMASQRGVPAQANGTAGTALPPMRQHVPGMLAPRPSVALRQATPEPDVAPAPSRAGQFLPVRPAEG